MGKVRAIWDLMRLEHGVMIAIAILIGSVIAAKTLPTFINFFLTFFTALFLEASTFALNDYYDYEIDLRNKRKDRPLVRGDVSKNTALYLFLIFFPLGIICSFFVNITCFLIALVTAIFAIFYDVFLKKVKLLGNFFIAYVMAIPFVFGAASILEVDSFSIGIDPAIWIIALIAFLAGAGREIMKDVMDFEGDKHGGVRSFPKYIGIRKSNFISAFFYAIAVLLSFIPFFIEDFNFYHNNFYYLFVVLVTDIMLLWTVWQLVFKKHVNLSIYRKITLLALFFGLIAFLIGAMTG